MWLYYRSTSVAYDPSKSMEIKLFVSSSNTIYYSILLAEAGSASILQTPAVSEPTTASF
jgi:hypothetical protein